MRKFLWRLIICFVFLVFSVPFNVSANAPPPSPWLSFYLKNLPSNIVNADLLIEINPSNPRYVSVNMQNLEQNNISAESEIVLYNADGFMSFTFHYKDAVSLVEVYGDHGKGRMNKSEGIGYIVFCRDAEYNIFHTQFEDLKKNFQTFRLVFFDENGTIISVSNDFSLPKARNLFVIQNTLTYDYETNNIYVSSHINPWFILISLCTIAFYVTLSVLIEFIVAIVFRFKGKALTFVVFTNMITQLSMRVAYVFLPLPHLFSVILLEFFVYSSEFFIYRKSKAMANEKTMKILIYTVVANTLSLVIIILLRGFVAWHRAF